MGRSLPIFQCLSVGFLKVYDVTYKFLPSRTVRHACTCIRTSELRRLNCSDFGIAYDVKRTGTARNASRMSDDPGSLIVTTPNKLPFLTVLPGKDIVTLLKIA